MFADKLLIRLVCFAIFVVLSRIQIDYFCILEIFRSNNTFRDFHAFIFNACNNLEAEKISYHYTALSLSLYISLYHITIVISKIFSLTSALNTLLDKMQIHFTKHRLKITTVRLTRAVRPLWRIRWLPDTILICTVVVFI